MYLTGYDVQRIDLRDIFITGNLPTTASAGQDPKDTISPQGAASQDINFASCSALPYPPGFVGTSFRSHLQAWLQGRPSTAPGLTNQCAGFDHDPAAGRQGDGILRGYITVDTVNACNLFFPSDWDLYDPFVTNQNVLWGDYQIRNNPENFAHGETLVHIEACASCFAPGDHTFYGRYNGGTAADSREALPTTLAARFIGGLFDSEFLVWREADQSDSPYPCTLPGPPSWYPLGAARIVLFDEQEHPVTVESCSATDRNCRRRGLIPNEANRVHAATGLLSPFPFGVAYFNLQHRGVDPTYGDNAAQAWVTAVMSAAGRYSVGFDAIQLDNAATPSPGIP